MNIILLLKNEIWVLILRIIEYIMHMDDDDYYPPESILARVKILMKYKDKGIECVGSSTIGIYNIMNKNSNIASDGDTSLSEASMGYTKKFWKEGAFNEEEERGEYRSFILEDLKRLWIYLMLLSL